MTPGALYVNIVLSNAYMFSTLKWNEISRFNLFGIMTMFSLDIQMPLLKQHDKYYENMVAN